MSAPGSLLYRLASRTCDEVTVARVVEPWRADLLLELATARTRLQRIWIRFAYATASLRIMAACILQAEGASRTLAFQIGGVLLTTIVFVVVPFWDPMSKVVPERRLLLALLLVPGALGVSLALGSCLGVVCAMGKRATSAGWAAALIFAFGCSVATAAVMQWLLPVANQAYRVTYFNQLAPPTSRRPIALLRGLGELSLTELAIESRRARFEDERQLATRELQGRLTIVAAPIPLTLFLLTFVSRIRFRRVAGLLLINAYYICLAYQRQFMRHSGSWTLAIAWTPTLLLLISTVVALQYRASPRE